MSEPTKSTFPDFDQPPVTEVVAGVSLRELKITSADLVLFWEQVREDLNLERVEEFQPYSPPIERFDVLPMSSISFGVAEQPPTPRLWFMTSDGKELIQAQRDWFACHWRKVGRGDVYERWHTRRAAFEKAFRLFADFLSNRGIASLDPVQCEVTYVNHIRKIPGLWESPGDFSPLLRISGKSGGDFLPGPEVYEVRTSYLIQDETKETVGRLHVAAQTAFARENREPILLLNLTARCRPPGKDLDSVLRSMNLAREWIVRAFVDITSERAHQAWGRRQ